MTFENKGIDTSTKVISNNSERLLSGFVEAKHDGKLVIAECRGYAHRLIKYSKDFWCIGGSDSYNFDEETKYDVEKGYFYRLNVKKASGSGAIAPDEFNYETKFEYELWEEDKYVTVNPGKNLLTKNIVRNNAYMTENGAVGNDYWAIGEKIDVKGHDGQTICCNAWHSSKPNIFVMSDGTTKSVTAADNKSVVIPDGAIWLIPHINIGNVPFVAAQVEIGSTTTEYTAYNPIGGYIESSSSAEVSEDNVVIPHVKGLKDDNADFPYDSETRLNDIYNWFDNLTEIFSHSMTKTRYGTTEVPTRSEDSNTYDMNAYVIEPLGTSKSKIILASGIHGGSSNGDEPTGVAALAYWVKDFMYNYNSNIVYEELRKSCTIVVMPVLNPWGYQNKFRGNGRSVDLNRNFDNGFTPNAESYDGTTSGTSAFSESESKAIRDYISQNHSDAKMYIEWHTRGKGSMATDNRWLLLHPSTFTDAIPVLSKIGSHLVSKYGGVVNVNSAVPEGHAYNYVNNVIGVKSVEPECFNLYNKNMSTYVNADTVAQNVDYVGTIIRRMFNSFK